MQPEKEEQILEFLKEKGRSSTTKVAYAINSNTLATRKYLDKLESEGKIIKEVETISTYWRIPEDGRKWKRKLK